MFSLKEYFDLNGTSFSLPCNTTENQRLPVTPIRMPFGIVLEIVVLGERFEILEIGIIETVILHLDG